MDAELPHSPSPGFPALIREQEQALRCLRRREGELACGRRRLSRLQGSRDPLLWRLLPQAREQLALLEQEQHCARGQLGALMAAVSGEIDRLPQERLRQILRYRHLELLSWREIGLLLELEPRWLMRLNRKAMEQLEGTAEAEVTAKTG